MSANDSDDSTDSDVPSAPNTPFAINIGGDTYTSRRRFMTVYNVNDAETDILQSLFDSKGTLRVDAGNKQALVIKALGHRIKNITEQFSSGRPNTLIYQPLREIRSKLQKIVKTLENGPGGATTATGSSTAAKKIPKMDTNLMSFLLRVGYAITHSEKIPDDFKEKWNTFVNATTALTESGGLLNIDKPPVPVAETNSFTISKNSFLKEGTNPPYKTVSEYLTAMTAVSDRQKQFTSQIEETIRALYTYQFIQESEKKAFESKNTDRIQKILPSLKKRLKTRFSNSMAIILEHYQQLFGPVLYATINSEPFLKIFTPPYPIQDALSMIEGILKNVYSKLYSTEPSDVHAALGIYKFDKNYSAKLIPLIRHYMETARGKSLPDNIVSMQLATTPFVWFQLGSDIIYNNITLTLKTALTPPARPAGVFAAPATTVSPITDETLLKLVSTFNNFINDDKSESVFMIVHNTFPSPSYFALLHTYNATKESDEITEWNGTLSTSKPFVDQLTTGSSGKLTITGGPRLSEIGMLQWPSYTTQTHLSLPMFQCMTFLAATNQTSEKTKRYENLVLPIP